MQRQIQIGTSPPIPFGLYDAATGQVGQTGQTGAAVNTPVALVSGVGGNITISIWRPGGSAFTQALGSVVEKGTGAYAYIPVAGDTSGATVADDMVLITITCPSCASITVTAQVVGFNPLAASVNLNTSEALPATGSLVAGSVGEALAAARALAIGKRLYNPETATTATITLYGSDGVAFSTQNVIIDANGNVDSVI